MARLMAKSSNKSGRKEGERGFQAISAGWPAAAEKSAE